MSELENLQNKFAAMIRKNDLQSMAADIIPGGRLDAQQALLVYQNGYFVRLTDAMGENFEAVWRILGDETFFSACREYISQNNSFSFNISDFGDGFPDFLQMNFAEVPFLAQLAEFEIEFRKLFHKKISIHELATDVLAGNDSRIEFGDNFCARKYTSPVYTLWKNRKEEDFALDAVDTEKIEIVFLYKDAQQEIFARIATENEWRMFRLLVEGKSIEAAVIGSGINDPEMVSGFFGFLKEAGMIHRII